MNPFKATVLGRPAWVPHSRMRFLRSPGEDGGSERHSGYLDCIGHWRMLAEGDIVICVPAAAGRGRCL